MNLKKLFDLKSLDVPRITIVCTEPDPDGDLGVLNALADEAVRDFPELDKERKEGRGDARFFLNDQHGVLNGISFRLPFGQQIPADYKSEESMPFRELHLRLLD